MTNIHISKVHLIREWTNVSPPLDNAQLIHKAKNVQAKTSHSIKTHHLVPQWNA